MNASTIYGRSARECPRCSGQAVARSHLRSVLGRVVFKLFRLGIYRCHECSYLFVGKPRVRWSFY